MAVASLTVCGVAQANSLSPFVIFWPGILHIAFGYSLPATVLVAILERDFFRPEGKSSGSLLLSLRANLLSTIVGILLLPATYFAMRSAFVLLLPFAAVAISCAVEIAYLRLYVERRFPIGRIVVANVLRSLLLALVPSVAEIISHVRPE